MKSLVSVVLPTYNGIKYLSDSVNSILNQTYTYLELIIINDGSTDGTIEYLKSITDERVRVFNLEKNHGLVYCLNLGIQEAKGEYIARMDADDISCHSRLEKQIKLLNQNNEIGICGTQIKILGSKTQHRRPCSDEELRWWIFKGSPFAHPTVMIRARVIKDNQLKYNANAIAAEDYDLWWRLAFFCKMANLEEVLLEYRIHESQESSIRADTQYNNHHKSLNKFMATIGIDPSEFESEWIKKMLCGGVIPTPNTYRITHSFFERIKSSAKAREFYSFESIKRLELERKAFFVKNFVYYDWSLLRYLAHGSFLKLLKNSNISILGFFLKSIINWKTRII